MRRLLSDSRQRGEKRLFDANARLERARAELAISEEQLAALEDAADEARVRSLVSETPLAERECQEAKRHADTLRRAVDSARASVRELEQAQDELIGGLIEKMVP